MHKEPFFDGFLCEKLYRMAMKMQTVYLKDFIGTVPEAKAGDCAQVLQNALEHIRTLHEPCTLSLPENGEIHIYKDFCAVREYHTSNTDSVKYPQKTIGILIENQEDLTVEGNGCRFILHGDMMALAVVHSKNICLKNFSWDFESPTVTQMIVQSAGDSTATFTAVKGCDFEIERGKVKWICSKSPYTGKPYYTAFNNHKSWCAVSYDPESGIQQRTSITAQPFSRAIRARRSGEREITVSYFGKVPEPWRKAGTVAQLCASRRRPTAGAFFWESEDITVDGVTPHYLHGFGWLTQMCKNVSYRNCRFEPGEGFFCTSYADLIHVSGAAGKIEIEDCTFSHPHDDPINIHGTFTRVEKVLDEKTLCLRYVHRQQGGFPQFHEGDEVIFYARDTLAGADGREDIYTVTKARLPGADGNGLKSMTVTFDRPLPACLSERIAGQPKYVAENVTYTPEVTVRSCTFDHVPTRGILCTTRRKVLIENNRFDHMAMACIFISNDSNEWYESGPVRDMTIRSNEFFIRQTGQKEWSDTPAVYVHPVVKGGKLPETPIHKNITIENNTVHLYHDKAFLIECVEGLTIRNNRILCEAGQSGKTWELRHCKQVDSDLTE